MTPENGVFFVDLLKVIALDKPVLYMKFFHITESSLFISAVLVKLNNGVEIIK